MCFKKIFTNTLHPTKYLKVSYFLSTFSTLNYAVAGIPLLKMMFMRATINYWVCCSVTPNSCNAANFFNIIFLWTFSVILYIYAENIVLFLGLYLQPIYHPKGDLNIYLPKYELQLDMFTILTVCVNCQRFSEKAQCDIYGNLAK